MKRLSLMLFALLALSFVWSVNTEAKWWIFGTSEDEIETSYLYLNRVSFSELGTKVTFYRDMLPNGVITIQGKAIAGKNKVGSVRVTLDGKETWADAKLSESGAFEFSFRPDRGRTYKVYVEVTDTTGKTNKIEQTYKEVTVSDSNIQAVVRDLLDKLMDAYRRENAAQFMALVSDDFAADKTILDRAVRKDFLIFDNIIMRYTLNNVTSDTVGKVFVLLTYNRQVTSTKSGKTLQDNGQTQFTFKMDDRGLRLWDMKIPLLFGLSDSSQVATGITGTTSGGDVIVVTSTGDVTTLPFNQAVQQQQSGSAPARSATLVNSAGIPMGLDLATGRTQSEPTHFPTNTDFLLTPPFIEPFGVLPGQVVGRPGVLFMDLGVKSIDTITEAPDPARGGYINTAPVTQGRAFAVRLPSNNYAVVEIISISSGPNSATFILRYKYQSTPGLRTF